MPTTLVLLFTSLFSRSSELFDQIFCQCSTGKAAYASTSSSASSISSASLANRQRKPSATLRHFCWAPFGTKERAFLMKCTRHLCQLAPVKTASTAPLSPRWASLVTNRTPDRPLATKERKKESQKEPSSLGPTSNPKTSLSPLSAFTPTAITTAIEAT